MENDFDFEARYTVDGHNGIAFYAIGYEMIRDEDYEWYENKERIQAVMVGDDRVWTFDVEDFTEIAEGDYCPECGQIGCKAYG